MKPTPASSLSGTREFAIDPERTIDFMGEDARVYATPMLVRDEVNAVDGEETVCRGRHARFVVDVAQAKKRLQQKKAKAM